MYASYLWYFFGIDRLRLLLHLAGHVIYERFLELEYNSAHDIFPYVIVTTVIVLVIIIVIKTLLKVIFKRRNRPEATEEAPPDSPTPFYTPPSSPDPWLVPMVPMAANTVPSAPTPPTPPPNPGPWILPVPVVTLQWLQHSLNYLIYRFILLCVNKTF